MELLEPDFKIIKVITFKKDKIEILLKYQIELKNTTIGVTKLDECESNLDIFREKTIKENTDQKNPGWI